MHRSLLCWVQMMNAFGWSAGKSYSWSNKEEKVNGHNHTLPCCVHLHISDLHLLVDQVSCDYVLGNWVDYVAAHPFLPTLFVNKISQ